MVWRILATVPLLAALLAALPAVLPAVGDAGPQPRRCPDGRFLVRDGPLLPGGPTPDVIDLSRGRVSIAAGCRARRATIERTPRGTRLVARWTRCGEIRRVTLSAWLSPDCTSLAGTVRAQRGRYRRAFTADRAADTATTATTTLAPTTTTLAVRLTGVGFGPYTGDQDPNRGAVVTRDQVRDRMMLLRPFAGAVRSYGSCAGLEHVGPVARELGMRATLGAWIGPDAAENDRQLASLIAALQAGHGDAGIVGSEALLRADVTPPTLAAYLDRVRTAVPGVPIGTADLAAELLSHPELLPHVDVLFVHIHPFWDAVPVGEAIARLADVYGRVTAIAAGKRVVIAETGWPTCGEPVGAAVPSPEHGARYLRAFLDWAGRTGVEYFWFEGSDEPWKAGYEGARGACWGLTDAAGSLKPLLRPVFDGAPAAPSPPAAQAEANAGISSASRWRASARWSLSLG